MENNIKKIRLSKNLKLREVAEKAGTSTQQIQRLEKGDRKLTTEWLERLSGALDCQPSDIVSMLATSIDPWAQEQLKLLNRLTKSERELYIKAMEVAGLK